MKIITHTIVLIISVFYSQATMACSLVPMSLPQRIEAADSIFEGEILRIDGKRVDFKVERYWKGEPGAEFYAYTATNTCGISAAPLNSVMVAFVDSNRNMLLGTEFITRMADGKVIEDSITAIKRLERLLGAARVP